MERGRTKLVHLGAVVYARVVGQMTWSEKACERRRWDQDGRRWTSVLGTCHHETLFGTPG